MRRLTFILLILGCLSLGCKFIDSLRGTGSGGGSANSPAGGSSTAGRDPKADIIASSDKFTALKSFSARTEGVGQTEIKSQIDYLAPDRYHVTYLAGTGSGMELIMIGNQSYMKPSGGSWTKMPGDAKAIPNLRDSFTAEGLKTLTDVKFEGEESLDGKQAMVYSYKNVTPVGNNPFTSKMWVGKESGLPVKIYVEYSNGVLKHMTITYDTDSPVTIEPPIK